MKLSIIVPVYNMAADGKLEYCMDSLVNQTMEDYESISARAEQKISESVRRRVNGSALWTATTGCLRECTKSFCIKRKKRVRM